MQPGFEKLIGGRSIDHAPASMALSPAAFDAPSLVTRRPEPSADDLYRHDQPARTKDALIGRSRALRQVIEQLNLVAATDSTVLLLGETGVGKELLATHLHEMSVRRNHQMVR